MADGTIHTSVLGGRNGQNPTHNWQLATKQNMKYIPKLHVNATKKIYRTQITCHAKKTHKKITHIHHPNKVKAPIA